MMISRTAHELGKIHFEKKYFIKEHNITTRFLET